MVTMNQKYFISNNNIDITNNINKYYDVENDETMDDKDDNNNADDK